MYVGISIPHLPGSTPDSFTFAIVIWFLMRSAQNHDAHWQLIDPVVRTTLNYININDDRNLLMIHSLPYGSMGSCTGTVSATHSTKNE